MSNKKTTYHTNENIDMDSQWKFVHKAVLVKSSIVDVGLDSKLSHVETCIRLVKT